MDIKKEAICNGFKKAGVGNFIGKQEAEEIVDEDWRNLLSRRSLPELEGFDEFDNDLVTSEGLSLEALIDSQNASKEREIDDDYLKPGPTK
ncbi:hypothetical protein QE152_g11383 [Popillia japonica]|uniref:Uncharacterized protein n=1 Tax=Popillia japonica TaxID=7064 RepID=A0AAW1LS92_POPJA